MNSGIIILNEIVQMPEKSGELIVMFVFFILIALVFAGYCVYSMYEILTDYCKVLETWIAFSVLCVFLAGGCVGIYFLAKGIITEKEKRETIVYATIDNTVPWDTVNDRYELIRQDGQIYQLKLKEEE